jgi:hypothetical protein
MNRSTNSSVAAWAALVRADHDRSLAGSLWVVAASLGVLAFMLFSGCSGSRGPAPVDPALARESLKVTLDHWKKGEDPKSLMSSVTPITAQDYEWTAGAKLLDYEILDQGNNEDANLRVAVKIKVEEPGKKKAVEKKASYVVGTSPSVTVFRDVMRH